MNGLVRLDADRQVVFGRPSKAPLWATWGRREVEDLHSWPCFAPGGARWAAFRISREGGVARTVVGEGTTGAEVESTPFVDGMPIYAAWSPGGRRLAALVQHGDRLTLEVLDPADPERIERWLEGSPLFFAWVDDDALVAHVGRELVGRRPTRSELVLARAGARVAPFVGAPGSFCTPVPTDAGIVWAGLYGPRAGQNGILVTPVAGAPSRELEVTEGLLALVGTPDGRVLRAVSADPDGGSYRDLRLLDPRTGRSARVSDTDHLAFLPVPGQEAVVVVRREPRRGTVLLSRVGFDGRESVVGELAPSRDVRFWLRFFEQFVTTHPLVSPDGRWLVACGARPGEDAQGPRCWLFPLDAGGPPEDLGPGPFACFAPPVSSPRPEPTP